MRILLIDDNRTNLIFLSKLVEKIGCVALAYLSPEEVLSDMPRLDYDIAVIDYQMPTYNGIELLTELRTSGARGGDHRTSHDCGQLQGRRDGKAYKAGGGVLRGDRH